MSNAATAGFGFAALWFSVLTPLIIMGWMITVTMLVSAASTLVLIPVLLRLAGKGKVSDMKNKIAWLPRESRIGFEKQ